MVIGPTFYLKIGFCMKMSRKQEVFSWQVCVCLKVGSIMDVHSYIYDDNYLAEKNQRNGLAGWFYIMWSSMRSFKLWKYSTWMARSMELRRKKFQTQWSTQAGASATNSALPVIVEGICIAQWLRLKHFLVHLLPILHASQVVVEGIISSSVNASCTMSNCPSILCPARSATIIAIVRKKSLRSNVLSVWH